MTLELLKIKWRQTRNSWAELPLAGVWIPLGYLVLFVLLCFLYLKFLPFLLTKIPDLEHELLVPSVFAVSVLFFLVGIFESSTVFYQSDVALLLTSPLPIRVLVAAKTIELTFPFALILLLFFMPFGIAFGYFVSAAFWYYPILLLSFLLYALLMTSLALLATVGLMRIVPSAYRKEFLSLLSGLIGFGLYLVLRSVQTSQLSATNQLFPPAVWLTHAWMAFAKQGFSGGLPSFLLLVLTVGVVFAVVILLLMRAIHEGWFLQGENEAVIQMQFRSRISLFSFLPPEIRAISDKDVTLLLRSPTELAGPLFTIVVVILSAMRLASDTPDSSVLIVCGVILFLAVLIPAMFSINSTGNEQAQFQILQTSPLAVSQILWGKFWSIFLFTVLPMMIASLIAGIWVGLSVTGVLLLLLLVVLLTAQAASIGVSCGYVFADLNAPKKQLKANPVGLILMAICLLAMMLVSLAEFLFTWMPWVSPKALHEMPAWYQQEQFIFGVLAGLLLFGTAAFGVRFPIAMAGKFQKQ